MQQRSTAILIALVLSALVVAPVAAATPSNDGYASRVVVDIPYEATLDTTDATSDADDIEANAACTAPDIAASVWYELTPTSDALLVVDTSGSDYAAGVAVLTGAPGSFGLEACGPTHVGFMAYAGVTYAIVVFDFLVDDGGNGGLLELSIDVGEQPSLQLTIDDAGSFDARTGAAIVTGTVLCSGGESGGKALIDAVIRQYVGRIALSGYGVTSFECDGQAHAWSIELFGEDGKFAGGKATVFVSAVACGVLDCAFDEVQQTIRLRR